MTAVDKSKVYGDTDPTLTYAVTTGSLVTGDSLTGALTRAAGENVSTYSIDASALANGNYLITKQNGTLTISQRPITVTAVDKSKVYGDTDPTLSYAVTTGSLVGSDSLTGALSRAAGENVNTYSIDASALANGNYLITANNGNLSITRRPLTVIADAKSKIEGAADQALTYQAEAQGISRGLMTGENLAGSLTRAAPTDYAIQQGTVANANNSNYNISYVGANLTINAAPPPPPDSTTGTTDIVTPPPPPPQPPPLLPPVTPPAPPTNTGGSIGGAGGGFTSANPLLNNNPAGVINLGGGSSGSVGGSSSSGLGSGGTSGGGTGPGATSTPGGTGASGGAGTGGNGDPGVTGGSAGLGTSQSSASSGTGGPANGGISVSLVKEPSVQSTGIIAVSVPKEMATAGSGFSFPLPAQVTDQDSSASTIQVATTGGEPLPDWLRFNPEAKAFVASAVPDGAFPIQVVVTVGGTRTTVVIISVRNE